MSTGQEFIDEAIITAQNLLVAAKAHDAAASAAREALGLITDGEVDGLPEELEALSAALAAIRFWANQNAIQDEPLREEPADVS